MVKSNEMELKPVENQNFRGGLYTHVSIAKARVAGLPWPNTWVVVHISVHIGNYFQGYGLAIDIKVEVVDEELSKADSDHQVC